jgi:hypothetical protein
MKEEPEEKEVQECQFKVEESEESIVHECHE